MFPSWLQSQLRGRSAGHEKQLSTCSSGDGKHCIDPTHSVTVHAPGALSKSFVVSEAITFQKHNTGSIEFFFLDQNKVTVFLLRMQATRYALKSH